MGWIRCFGCEKLQRDFMAQTFALIAPVHPVLHRVSCSYKMIQMHQNMSLGSNGVDQVRWLRKLERDFVARTFALIAPVLSVLQQVSCSCETIPNARKYYETHQNISLGCNGADWVHSLGKNLGVTSRHELLH